MKRPGRLASRLEHAWRSGQFAVLYLVLLAGWASWLLLSQPITAGDTDLWLHLGAGRYIVEHGAIPRETFFSFLNRPWIDYSWLYQLLLYLVFAKAGYYGLLAWRTLTYVGTASLIAAFLFTGSRGSKRPRAWPAALFVVYLLAFLPRYFNVRPHALTYGLIVALLWILERRPRGGLIALPILAVLWCNLHGFAFPLVLLIVGSYSVEYLLGRCRRAGTTPPMDRRFVLAASAAMLAIYLTPHGLRLLEAARASMAYVSGVVAELRPLPLPAALESTLSLQARALMLPRATLFNVVALGACLALITGAAQHKIRLAHVLLWIGGVIAWLQGERFAHEFVLLCLPLLAAHPPMRLGQRGLFARAVAPALGVLVLAAPVSTLSHMRPRAGASYPFSQAGLPQGTVAFLERLAVGGTIFHSPNEGGYLQWRLSPRYKIFMTMHIPLPFTEEDVYTGFEAFSSKAALTRMVSRYRPSFILAPLGASAFPKLIHEFPDYPLVFFDDASALFVDRRQHPTVAGTYELKRLDPFELMEKGIDSVIANRKPEELLQETMALLHIDSNCGLANQLAAALYQQRKEYAQMMPHAEAIIRNFPTKPLGYQLVGDAWRGLHAPERAIEAYAKGVRRVAPADRAALYQAMGSAYAELKRYAQAYQAFHKGVDVFSPETSLDALYEFGLAAERSGHHRAAEALFTFLVEARAAPGDTTWAEKVRAQVGQRSLSR